MSSTNSSDVLGIVLLARHGDRNELFQDPNTYDVSFTTITPLGEVQEFQLGSLIRSIYLNSSSPSFIQGINNTIVDQSQIDARADGSDEGGVIINSAIALLQGLFPATPAANIMLANGTTVTSPLGGYQYVALETVQVDDDISLEGWTDCTPFNDATTAFYNSPEFLAVANASSAFLAELPQFLGGRAATLQNIWNIYDFMNVNFIHDAAFANALPLTLLEQARNLANFHEHGVFTSPQPTGIGNIGGAAILPSIITGLNSISNSSDTLKILYEAISYKPFLSLFNITGAADQQPNLADIVDYAAAFVIEVRQPPAASEPILRFQFKNGTTDPIFHQINLLGQTGDVPLSLFVNQMAPLGINDTAEWCNVCQNTQDRGCSLLTVNPPRHELISPIGAGFLGAGLTFSVVALFLAFAFFTGRFKGAPGNNGVTARKGSTRDLGTESEDKA
ncbi:phosphoglycerate mutase-like protein [Pluteus cervinus]|uniref:Phosphoglycerate mutase-like protein n=1 Tax=Pluteus cervinus TaxID=181527 RepID=A0ACD3AKP0_9AGAR|nr:phosphoglycerate mutase-like protein [Pluteus cervinus]